MLPSFRSRGIGSMVIAAVLADAAEAGVPVEMEIHTANEALRLCRRLGFEVDRRARGPAAAALGRRLRVPAPRADLAPVPSSLTQPPASAGSGARRRSAAR